MYTNNINIIGRIKQDTTAALSVIEREPTDTGLAVNKKKPRTKVTWGMIFDVVNDFFFFFFLT